MKKYILLVALLSILPPPIQNNKPIESSDIPTVTFCALVHNPDIFNGQEVRFHVTYLANSKVATLVDQNCLEKDKRTWVEFDGISIKASSTPELHKRVEEEILCGKCGDDNKWRETDMLVTGVFNADDTGHGRLGKYRFLVTVKKVEEMSETVRTEKTRFDLRQ